MVTYFQIIGAVITYKRLSRNPTNMFILNLAVADLGVAAITNPVHIASKFKKKSILINVESRLIADRTS